jgi:hypothetical protein
VRSLADVANAQFPFDYRVDVDDDWFTIVPTRTRDSHGRSVQTTPLLGRHVTIPAGTRSIAATAALMADALYALTGVRVDCCQPFVAGLPWGMAEGFFSATDESARSVLKRFITMA